MWIRMREQIPSASVYRFNLIRRNEKWICISLFCRRLFFPIVLRFFLSSWRLNSIHYSPAIVNRGHCTHSTPWKIVKIIHYLSLFMLLWWMLIVVYAEAITLWSQLTFWLSATKLQFIGWNSFCCGGIDVQERQ